MKLSPNTAEAKTGRLGLRDLGRLAEAATKEEGTTKPQKPAPKKASKTAKKPHHKPQDTPENLLTIKH